MITTIAPVSTCPPRCRAEARVSPRGSGWDPRGPLGVLLSRERICRGLSKCSGSQLPNQKFPYQPLSLRGAVGKGLEE